VNESQATDHLVQIVAVRRAAVEAALDAAGRGTVSFEPWFEFRTAVRV
jgi:hypothetical protein